jgi:hypothetical protein
MLIRGQLVPRRLKAAGKVLKLVGHGQNSAGLRAAPPIATVRISRTRARGDFTELDIMRRAVAGLPRRASHSRTLTEPI